MKHNEARAIITTAFRNAIGRDGRRSELQCLQAVGWLETNYAASWKPPGNGSFNWGAIQGSADRGSFTYTDTHPNEDGTSTPYSIAFRRYSSLELGAEDLARVVYMARGRNTRVLPYAASGSIRGFSAGLHATGYYEGFGATVEQRVSHHQAAVLNACRLQALAIGEEMPDGTMPEPLPPAAIRQGSSGERVAEWQRVLAANGYACTADGVFGVKTRALTMLFQRAHGLTVDGVVGAKTWAAAHVAPVAPCTEPDD